MTYEEFLKFVPSKCMYETIYDDSDGRPILVIRLLDAFGMVNKAQREWVGLTAGDLAQIETDEFWQVGNHMAIALAVEDKLKEKNHD